MDKKKAATIGGLLPYLGRCILMTDFQSLDMYRACMATVSNKLIIFDTFIECESRKLLEDNMLVIIIF